MPILGREGKGGMEVTENTPDAVQTKPAPKKKKKSASYYAILFFVKLAVLVIAAWIFFTFAAGIYICHTNSAHPSVKDGDLCIVNRLADPAEGSMVAYVRDGTICFGRAVAFSGDLIDIRQGSISVNGTLLSAELSQGIMGEGAGITFPYRIPEGGVFILSDNREDTQDSRSFGAVPKKDVKGTVALLMRMRGI